MTEEEKHDAFVDLMHKLLDGDYDDWLEGQRLLELLEAESLSTVFALIALRKP